MTRKELNAVRRIEREAERLEQRLKNLRGTIAISRHDGLPRNKSTTSRVERIAIEIIEVRTRLEEARERLLDEKIKLLRELQTFDLSGMQMQVMKLRTVACMSTTETAKHLEVSRRYVNKMFKAAQKIILEG